ncbi:hypothetical protein L1787_04450 [Acuticoccus sp. M5D2P5]|uniref:calcium-binding protein n=1 Tax=Acuticoccus kalidii TaxID=2910977 RepID=UPI001F398816|nr:calcium-binding protein [Acuticoccus kalidii]MCF3932667.1 hypothetical protein [Acuticoccus kalidii]
MIVINAKGVQGGIDYVSYLANYYAGLGVGSSVYRGGTPDAAFGGEYYVSGPEVSFSYEDSDKVALLEGTEIAYDFIHHGAQYGHGISGEIDSVTFAETTSETTTNDGTENGLLVNLNTGLVVSGLDISAEPGAGNDPANPVYALYSAVRYGANGEDGEDYIAQLYETFGASAQKFIGSNGDDIYVGTDFDDVVFGNAGNDSLSGGAGNDTIRGGGGADTIEGGDGDDLIGGNGGSDLLMGGSGNDSLFGHDGHDELHGGAGDDYLNGGAGNDQLFGDEGDDIVIGGAGNDSLFGGEGNDSLFGNGGDDLLNGGAGDDIMRGGLGNNTFIGGEGYDIMIGGAGNDTFVFESADDSPFATPDRIVGFSEGDLIDLSAFDMDSDGFIGEDAFSGEGPEVRINHVQNGTVVLADTNGDGTADMRVFVQGAASLSADDFLI